tara:strand:+ start:225 stop:887 length:663 start_codon:yes stop_codon:yes gene_type:complete
MDSTTKMIVDDREHDLIARLKMEKVDFTVQRLPLGDILLERNGTTCLIERKRTDDFAASITDGRWREQKARLKQSGAIVVYLIEGSLYQQSKSPETLSSAIWNTMLRDKMWVIQTRGLEDTSLHLQQLARKIGKEIKGGTGVKSLLSKRKRKIDNVFLLMLMSVPSISERIATVLVEHWPTLKDLQRQLVEDDQHLRTLQVTEKRKIGPAVINSLKQHLC